MKFKFPIVIITITIVVIAIVLLNMSESAKQIQYYVSPNGNDTNIGTVEKPFASLEQARDAIRKAKPATAVTVYLREGTYYLPETFILTAEDSGTKAAPITYQSYPGENATISGGANLNLKWTPYKNGIMKADFPKNTTTDQLFVNGQQQQMARFPNYDANQRIFNGYDPQSFSTENAKKWADPAGGFMHAMHSHRWGGFHYLITGKDDEENLTYKGGWQNNRGSKMHDKYRFVENIFEELDTPGEWFLNKKQSTLYYYPPKDLDLENAKIETVRLRHLIELKGTEQNSVKYVNFKNLTFRHTARTFMDTKEPLLRSDWTTYRGGAIFFNGATDCKLQDSHLDKLGGNAVFVNKFNRRINIVGCHISEAGANGIAFVGDPNAVRNPLSKHGHGQKYKDIDKTPGPKTNNFPADCTVDDCLIYRSGRVEKQTAAVQISMAQSITVRHCSIYDVPRAGINISEGTWGGHLIEFCDVFDTVKETGDHGSFNSWGRDRFWGLKEIDLNKITTTNDHNLPILDVVKTNIIRNSRWRCDHGWDIDLDDGSSNYQIYNNLSLNGGIKLREGFYRICENNIMVNNSFHPHVWYKNSQDIFRNNIVFTQYKPIRLPKKWGKQCDYNILHDSNLEEILPAADLQKLSNADVNSITANAMFIDPANGDYRVAQNSPALKLGFKNFPMDKFGVQKPELKAIAKTPVLPKFTDPTREEKPKRSNKTHDWLGAKIKNIVGLGEVSATGLHKETGVWITKVNPGSIAEKIGLKEADVIIQLGNKKIETVNDLLTHCKKLLPAKQEKLTIFRNQSSITKIINTDDITSN